MKKILLSCALLLTVGSLQGGQTSLRESFVNPGADRATVPLWHLNGRLTREEITRQIEDAKKSGFSGFATLPVSATQPRYLSDEFIELYGHILGEAKRLGMQVIFYDDMDFPSGIAAHDFRPKHPQQVMKSLMRHEKELKQGESFAFTPARDEPVLSAMAYRTGTCERVDLRPAAGTDIRWQAPADGWRVTVCTLKDTGNGVVDYLSSEACDQFIAMTYEVFYRKYPEYFGTTIRQVFFDDVSLCHDRSSRAWTPTFNASFKKRLGYDPAPLYPALWQDIGPETAAARVALFGHRAWMLANEGYPARVAAWCRKRGVLSAGHTTDNYSLSPMNSGGDYMLFGSQTDSPLMDSIHWYGHGRSGFKLTSSAACNFDKPRCSVEIYGNYRPPFKPDMLYRAGMELFARGANFFIPHGMWYVPAKMHIPPLISPYNPNLAAKLPAYNAWAARHQVLLEGGRHVADIAVLYPIDALEAAYTFDRPRGSPTEWGGESNPFFDYLVLSDMLATRCHRDFTFLHPAVFLGKRCKVTRAGLELRNKINHEKYSALFLPSGACLSEAVLRKARDFAAAGGLVIATGQLPYFASEEGRSAAVRALVRELFGVEPLNHTPKFGTRLIGSDDRELDTEARKIYETSGKYTSRPVGRRGGRAVYLPAITPALIEQALSESRATPDVQFTGLSADIAPLGVFGYLHKVRDGLDLYLFANSTDRAVKAPVTLRGKFAKLEAWDPAAGRIEPVALRAAKNVKGASVTEAELMLQPMTDVFWAGKAE